MPGPYRRRGRAARPPGLPGGRRRGAALIRSDHAAPCDAGPARAAEPGLRSGDLALLKLVNFRKSRRRRPAGGAGRPGESDHCHRVTVPSGSGADRTRAVDPARLRESSRPGISLSPGDPPPGVRRARGAARQAGRSDPADSLIGL